MASMYITVIYPYLIGTAPVRHPYGTRTVQITYKHIFISQRTNQNMGVSDSERPDMGEIGHRMLKTSDPSHLPAYDRRSLFKNGDGTLRMTIMREALDDSGRCLDDPGCALQMYFPEAKLLIVDLS